MSAHDVEWSYLYGREVPSELTRWIDSIWNPYLDVSSIKGLIDPVPGNFEPEPELLRAVGALDHCASGANPNTKD